VQCIYQLPGSILNSDCTETLQVLGVVLVAAFFLVKRLYSKDKKGK